MELTAYLHPGWAPLIRPAPATRAWMDATPESFAYRCLPLNIANAHGWEILSPCGFEAVWDGGSGVEAVSVRPDAGADPRRLAVSLFGQGILSFHVEAILRTAPGWNLWVSGSPNRQKDAIAPLSAVIETDWSPFTFTMNWRFTRPDTPVRFEAMEPFCFLFPVQRAVIEAFEPAFAPLGADPATEQRFQAWSEAHETFRARLKMEPPKSPDDNWQKHYFRGIDVAGDTLIEDHRTELRLKAFDRGATPALPAAPASDAPPAKEAAPAPATSPPPGVNEEIAALRRALAKRDWLLETLERQRDLAPATASVERRVNLSAEAFLNLYYAPGRPVILAGEMTGWPALSRWTPDYLKAQIGSAVVEYQGGRTSNARFEMDMVKHRREAPFDSFIDTITAPGAGNDAYITANNSERNLQALAPLDADMGSLEKFLVRGTAMGNGMMWIGPAGTFTPLHHDLTNNFIAQVVGRKRVKLIPAAEVGRLYNHVHVFSEITDLDASNIDVARHPRLAGTRAYDLTIEPGEILFVPLAWWHQVRSLDFSVTVTYTNFRWANDAYATYPGG